MNINIQSQNSYQRRPTKTVWVGGVAIGSAYPIRVQSMVTADTKDVNAVLAEIKALVNVGCELVRLTVPTKADAQSLVEIRQQLKKEGIFVPLVADIHFTPSVALDCVPYVDKVRINPGNFVDKKLFKTREYTDAEYQQEILRIREKFIPLVLKCKEHGVAMRIGTNHGSLSDRIMNRYGDTPLGMVESALEFLRICEELDYQQIILSMKASNVVVMTEAYRLLAQKMDADSMNYPLHLGVTEAGDGDWGRIKSAIGIGSLLLDGLGDTVRVSLTEDAPFEIPVAYNLVRHFNFGHQNHPNQALPNFVLPKTNQKEPQAFQLTANSYGAKNPPRVFSCAKLSDLNPQTAQTILDQTKLGNPNQPLEGLTIDMNAWDEPSLTNIFKLEIAPLDIGYFFNSPQTFKTWSDKLKDAANSDFGPKLTKLASKWVFRVQNRAEIAVVLQLLAKNNLSTQAIGWVVAPDLALDLKENDFFELKKQAPIHFFTLKTSFLMALKDNRAVFKHFEALNESKIIQHGFHFHFDGPKDQTTYKIDAATQIGALFLEKLGHSFSFSNQLALGAQLKLAYNILQGCRLYLSEAEFISCPSCGRTLFDLQTTTQKVKEATGHLKGVKIAVMGCIVNGPGEMADADFGYVGVGKKKISLYVGHECVERGIDESLAVERLVALIKKNERWVDQKAS